MKRDPNPIFYVDVNGHLDGEQEIPEQMAEKSTEAKAGRSRVGGA